MLKKLNMQFPVYGVGHIANIMSILFAVSHKQLPLFSSNQNTYLLHGIAAAVGEPLANDWLANQTSNVPVFSWFIEASYKVHPDIFYIYHFCLAYILIFSLYKISTHFQPDLKKKIPTVLFFTSISFLNYIQIPILSGIAGQYILGSVFQPSAFGVFLVTSIALFLHKQIKLAVLSCLIAAYFHPTYVLHAGILVFTYQVILAGERKYKSAFAIGVLALVMVFPLLFFVYSTLVGSAPTEISSAAQRILVLERIPHHALLGEFLPSKLTVFCLLIIGMAGCIGRADTELLKILSVPFVFCVIFVLIAVLNESYFMMLLFGHRSSVWLVPISSAYVIARLCIYVDWGKVLNVNKLFLLCTPVLFMSLLSTYELSNKASNHASHKSNQLFSVLADFNYREGVLLVPPYGSDDLRLNANAPIFIDWKSHPYKAEAVIEWFDRVNLAREFYQSESAIERSAVFNKIQAREKISYIISDIKHPLDGCRPHKEIGSSVLYYARDCYFGAD